MLKKYTLLSTIFSLFLPVLLCGFFPWGNDADLAHPPTSKEIASVSTPLFGPFAEVAIGFHQTVLSPADGPRSHFIPSSSQYTLDAMRKYGFFYGYLLGCDRLMRENNDLWVYREVTAPDGKRMKWDPVR